MTPVARDRPRLGGRFITIWIGQTASGIGSVVAAIGVAVHVFVETGNAAWLGLLSALTAAPFALTGPLMGLVDRIPRRTTMIVGDAIAASGSVVALALAIAGSLEVWHLAVAGFVGGLGSSFQFPASQAAIPSLVAPEALGRANGLVQLGPAAGIVLGPVVATPLIAWWGVEAVLIVDVITFAIAIGTVIAVRFVDVDDGTASDDTGRWGAVWTYLRGDGRPIATLLLVMAVVNFCLAFFNIALLTIATEVGGVARAGVPLGAAGLAMIATSAVLGSRGVPARPIRAFAIALGGLAAGCLVAASRPSFALVVVGAVVAVVAVPVVQAGVATLFHEHTPSRMHGRVFGLRSAIGRALEPVGSVLAGVVIARAATPSMLDGGALEPVLGPVLGTGAGRGAAVVLVATALAIATLAAWLVASSLREAFDAPGVDGDADGGTDRDVGPRRQAPAAAPDHAGAVPQASWEAAASR